MGNIATKIFENIKTLKHLILMDRPIILNKIYWYLWRHQQKIICQQIRDTLPLVKRGVTGPYCSVGMTGAIGPVGMTGGYYRYDTYGSRYDKISLFEMTDNSKRDPSMNPNRFINANMITKNKTLNMKKMYAQQNKQIQKQNKRFKKY